MRRVKLYSTDVIEVAEESEEATAELVVPAFDLVVVAAGGD